MQHRWRLRLLVVVATALCFSAALSALPVPSPRTALADWDEETAALLPLLNAYRASQQQPAPPLALDAKLQVAADWMVQDQLVTADCIANSNCSHVDTMGRDVDVRAQVGFGYGGQEVVENIAWGHSTAASALDGWKHSPLHDGNVRNATYTAVGIGRQCNAVGVCLWVAVFGDAVGNAFDERAATPTSTDAAAGWTGTWATDFGTLVLVQAGARVSGSFSFRSPATGSIEGGTISGTVSGEVLSGTWNVTPAEPPYDSGSFRFRLAPDGQRFRGDILYGDGSGDIWDGIRAAQ